MNRIAQTARKIDSLAFRLPLYGDVDMLVKEGGKISKGDPIYKTSAMAIKDSYYLPKLLAAQPKDCIDFLARVSGEYVSKGDLLAERVARGGLVTKRVLAGSDGVVSTSRIQSGYLDILDELKEQKLTSIFNATVKEISMTKGVLMESKGLRVNMIAANNSAKRLMQGGSDIVGEMEVIGDGTLVYTSSDLKGSYSNKIVYAGRFLYADFAKLTFEHDPRVIITYSMDYQTFNELDIPIFVVGGFGHIRADGLVSSVISQNKSNFVKISLKSEAAGQLINLDIVNGKYKSLSNDNSQINPFFGNAAVGLLAKSIDVDSYGFIGKIIDLDEEREIMLLQNSANEKVLVPITNIELV